MADTPANETNVSNNVASPTSSSTADSASGSSATASTSQSAATSASTSQPTASVAPTNAPAAVAGSPSSQPAQQQAAQPAMQPQPAAVQIDVNQMANVISVSYLAANGLNNQRNRGAGVAGVNFGVAAPGQVSFFHVVVESVLNPFIFFRIIL